MDDIELILIAGVAILVLNPELLDGAKAAANGAGKVLNDIGGGLSNASAIENDVWTFINWFPDVISSGSTDYANNQLHNKWQTF